jgi:two-component system, chemotaxis family, sensor kinase CheA
VSFFGDDRGAELRELFFESAAELLQAMNDGGLELEERPGDPETIRKVRRAVHTLKGDSASCGFRELSALAHLLEDVLTPETFESNASALPEVVLTAADTFDEMLAAYRGEMQPPDGRALRELIQGVLKKPGEPQIEKPQKSPLVAQFAWTEYEQLMISEAMKRGETVFFVGARVAHDAPMPAAAIQLAKNALAASGTIIAIRPEEGADLTDIFQIEAAVSSTQTMDWIRKKCRIPSLISEVVVLPAGAAPTGNRDLLEILLESEAAAVASGVPAEESDVESEAEADAGSESYVSEPEPHAQAEARHFASSASNVAPAGAENILRVDAARIDNVMNLVGELIIGKSMLQRTIIEFEKQHAKDPLRAKLSDALAYQTRVLSDLQKSVMKIRMVPVEQLFRRFPRVVRDVAKQRNKDIAVEMAGQTTDLDKGILDALAEPLVHLVRNAADHGIESTAERVRAGKTPRGTIRLNAYHKASQVVIEVSDDGRGLNREKIVQRAIERGLVTKDEGARLSDSEALQLIFKPGLTTADEVTAISGRGVGMDVVSSAIERLKGFVEISTQPGKGTTFSLMLPLTLASIKALMFYADGKLYAVPLSAVVEIARTQTTDITRVEDREVLRLRDQLLALVRLESSAPSAFGPKSGRLFVIVITTGPRKFGLVVDRLVGEEELVMKALEDRTSASDLVSGASILGDGTVVLILNVATVVQRISKVPLGATA